MSQNITLRAETYLYTEECIMQYSKSKHLNTFLKSTELSTKTCRNAWLSLCHGKDLRGDSMFTVHMYINTKMSRKRTTCKLIIQLSQIFIHFIVVFYIQYSVIFHLYNGGSALCWHRENVPQVAVRPSHLLKERMPALGGFELTVTMLVRESCARATYGLPWRLHNFPTRIHMFEAARYNRDCNSIHFDSQAQEI